MKVIAHLKSVIGRLLDRRFPRAWLAFRIWRRDRHFEPEFWLIPLLARKTGVAVDVGANMGEYAYMMARHAARVVAFEPNLDLHPALKSRLPAKVELISAALSRASGETQFRVPPGNTGVATIEPRNPLDAVVETGNVQSRTVHTCTLDSFHLADVDLIKIDVEGHEESVIAGGRETLQANRPALIVESENRHNPGAPLRLWQALTLMGYAGFVLVDAKLKALKGEGEAAPGEMTLAQAADAGLYNYIYLPRERVDDVLRLVARLFPR